MLLPLRCADFRRLWIAQTVSIVGDKINQIGLSIMVFRVTGSAAQMGIVFALTFLPAALFGLLAGPLVDRWDHRRTMITADLVRVVLVSGMALVAVASLADSQKIVAIYALAFASSTASLFFEPSRMSLVPAILPEDQLMAANSLDMTTMSVSELLGIAFGGGLVAALGYAAAFWIDAATFLVSAAFVLAVAHRLVPVQRARMHARLLWDDLREGIGRIRRNGVLRELTLTYVGLALCGGAIITVSVLLGLQVYREAGLADALRLTVVDLATTVGVLLGSVAVGIGGARRPGLKYLWGVAVLGVVMAQFFWVPNLWVAAVGLAAAGVANQYVGVPMITMLQTYTEPETRGRVFAVRLTITRVAVVIGLAGSGIAAQVYGVVPMAVAIGVVLVVLAALGSLMPRLRAA